MAADSIIVPKNYKFESKFRELFQKITPLFETFCINTPYDKEKLRHGAIT